MIEQYSTVTNADGTWEFTHFQIADDKLDLWHAAQNTHNESTFIQQGQDEGWLVLITI